MSVSFEGIGQVCATFLGSGLTEGHVVRMAGQAEAGACGDGDPFCANGEGGVRAAGESAGRACLVVDADAAAKTVTILL